MSSFLEQYGVAIFTLVLVAILIAFAGPLGMKIKNATTDKVSQTEQIGCDEITVATGGTVRPAEPAEAVDKVYCIYYDDGEMTISQNEIEPEEDRTVVSKGFYAQPFKCTKQMTTARFVGAVKPKNCNSWFYACENLIEIKNIKNLYTDECTDMNRMFFWCKALTNLDLSHFDTSNVTDMELMFYSCEQLTNLDLNNFDTNKVTKMRCLFCNCIRLTNLDLSHFNTSNTTDMYDMFENCSSLMSIDFRGFDLRSLNIGQDYGIYNMFEGCTSLQSGSVKILQTTYNQIIEKKGSQTFEQFMGKSQIIFNIVDN